MYGSDPGTGQHGGSKEGTSWHVQCNSVSFLNPLRLQGIGYLTRHLQQLPAIRETEKESKLSASTSDYPQQDIYDQIFTCRQAPAVAQLGSLAALGGLATVKHTLHEYETSFTCGCLDHPYVKKTHSWTNIQIVFHSTVIAVAQGATIVERE